MLPTKPSLTMTSTLPEKRSPPSTFPTKCTDLFFTDREQAHARTLAAKRRAVIDFAHHCKLHKMLRLRIHIRAHVQEHGDAALGVGKRSCQRDAIHRFQRSEQKLRDGHDRAGVSR